jgi:hypothetical protein
LTLQRHVFNLVQQLVLHTGRLLLDIRRAIGPEHAEHAASYRRLGRLWRLQSQCFFFAGVFRLRQDAKNIRRGMYSRGTIDLTSEEEYEVAVAVEEWCHIQQIPERLAILFVV